MFHEESIYNKVKWAIGELNPGSQVFTFYRHFANKFLYVYRSFIRPALVGQAYSKTLITNLEMGIIFQFWLSKWPFVITVYGTFL